MYEHEKRLPASQLAEHGAFPLVRDLRYAHVPPAMETKGHRSETTWHNLDGQVVQCNEAHSTLIVDGFWIRLSPLEYRILMPLLKAYNHPVSTETLCCEVFAARRTVADDRRIYRHIDRMRSKLAPFGLIIRAVRRHGYMLLRDAESEA